MIQQVDIQD